MPSAKRAAEKGERSSVGGLPALPLLSIAFLAVNADLLWKRRRERPRESVTDP